MVCPPKFVAAEQLRPDPQDRAREVGCGGRASTLIRDDTQFIAGYCEAKHRLEEILAELGWGPQETFESGLRKTVEWYLANRTWWERIRSGVYRGERLGVVA